MAVGLIILRTVQHVHPGGKDVYHLYNIIQFFNIIHNVFAKKHTAIQILLSFVQKKCYS